MTLMRLARSLVRRARCRFCRRWRPAEEMLAGACLECSRENRAWVIEAGGFITWPQNGLPEEMR
jgi:hypothetical protein